MMTGRIRKLAVGAGVLMLGLPLTAASCDPDLSSYCSGFGNMPYDCAAKILGGNPIPANSGNTLRTMDRPNRPAPTQAERDSCTWTLAVLYQDGDSRRPKGGDACQVLLHRVHWWDLGSQTRVS